MNKKELWYLLFASCFTSAVFLIRFKHNLFLQFSTIIYYSAGLCFILIPFIIGIFYYNKEKKMVVVE